VKSPDQGFMAFEDVPDLLNLGGNGFDGKTIIRPE
jgi:hypothetical protein